MAIEILDSGACKAAGRLFLPVLAAPGNPPTMVGQGIKSLLATDENTVVLELVEAIAAAEFLGFAQFTSSAAIALADLDGIAINVRWVDATHIEITCANPNGAKGAQVASELFFIFYRLTTQLLAGTNEIP